jgi:hypothetical protein
MVYKIYVHNGKFKYDGEKYLTMPEKTYTNIRLTTITRDRLKAIGAKGESFDDVIVRLLDTVGKKTSEMQGTPDGIPANS